MGVMKITKDLFSYCPGSDTENILEPDLSSEDEAVPTRVRRRIQRPQKSRIENQNLTEAVTSRRKGAKQARRCQNLQELLSMVEKEDLELDFGGFQPHVSAFAQLFAEKEKMKVWNDFINSTEEEQSEFLKTGVLPCDQHRNQNEDDSQNNNGLDETWVCVPKKKGTDKRSAHPSFSAEACFLKLDKNLRTMLKRRHRPMVLKVLQWIPTSACDLSTSTKLGDKYQVHVLIDCQSTKGSWAYMYLRPSIIPQGMLNGLENEIISFFLEWPTSVYISTLSSSYERMMVHAVCQYLGLLSKSFDAGGLRQTQVENLHPTFKCPPILLTEYLEKLSASKTSSTS